MSDGIPVVVGIDPGQKGGFAVLSLDGVPVEVGALPIVEAGRKRYDLHALRVFLVGLNLARPIRLVALEQPGARPPRGSNADADARGQSPGASTIGPFWRDFGRLEGMLETLGLPLELPAPRRWQKAVLPPFEAGKSKDAAADYAARRFPGARIVPPRCRKPHEGICDALGLAEWARRRVTGQGGGS